MNMKVYRKIAKDEGLTIPEAVEMWKEELLENGDNIEDALHTFGMELDFPFI